MGRSSIRFFEVPVHVNFLWVQGIKILGLGRGILGSIPWTIACGLQLRHHALMLDQVAPFDCSNAYTYVRIYTFTRVSVYIYTHFYTSAIYIYIHIDIHAHA